MKTLLKEILNEIKKSSFSVLPIFFLIFILMGLKVVTLSGMEILTFVLATVFVILGISLFNYGADHAMTPIGKSIGKGLTKTGKVWVLFLVVFLFGLLITIAEPDLSVLAEQTVSVFKKPVIIISVGLSVAFFLLLAILKILKKIDLIRILSLLYMIAFALVGILIYQGGGKENMIALCFDSGGVTTGPMTVPFIMALGAGVSSVLAQKSEKDASFGFIAFSSIGPVLILIILSIFTSSRLEYHLIPENYQVASNFFPGYGKALLSKLGEVGLSIGLILVCFLVINFIFLKSNWRQILLLIRGLFIAYIGLVLFLAAVDCTYIGIGFQIGSQLASNKPAIAIVVAFVIGALTVLAEPAIKVLIEQVQDMTNGLVKKRGMLIALSIGVGASICLALARIIFNFSILYIIIPGYILCFILSFFIPKIYTAIAFDAGGVASGPLTSSFILPIALGLCYAMYPGDDNAILSLGFGVVALVALSPLISIEVLGVVSVFTNKYKAKKAIKLVKEADDKIIIKFGE